ncbi:MAG: pyridine nucleotide-disulfide oxidoreductase [Tenericutes bacterium HGW-Tenericutes-2]|jgi:thioredoxin reductase|nr:MAG: pyridine nucleotide-disulfide oxidoreductase [Tenericutes bacterium HGW-Tenericutes-2]
MKVDIAVIGGGAAGLAAAIQASDSNLNILIIEREKELGGILNQCIHTGFGLEFFHEELTGPEYAFRFIESLKERNINVLLNTTVIDIVKNNDFLISISSIDDGYQMINAKSVIISSGCFERTRGAIMIPGERPKGIMPAGSAQRYLNIDGYLVGKDVFILGSGDIGLIMARRMTLEGAKVHGVAEIMPYSNGLNRNIAQCLEDFDIPLYLSHTVTDIQGKNVLEEITISEVDQSFNPIKGTEKTFKVDTLLLSIGLIPDIQLFESLTIETSKTTKSAIVNQHYQTNIEGLYVCGNALHVHDLVDWVTKESELVGQKARNYCLNDHKIVKDEKHILLSEDIRYTVPQKIDFNQLNEPFEILFRVTRKMEKGTFKIIQDGKVILSKKRKHIAPAEMEKILLKPSDFISRNEITIELEESK